MPVDRTAIVGRADLGGGQVGAAGAAGRNSWTVPLTSTASPTLTVGAALVKTKMRFGCRVVGVRVGILEVEAVGDLGGHDAGDVHHRWPAKGERWAAPCISWIRNGPGVGAAVAVAVGVLVGGVPVIVTVDVLAVVGVAVEAPEYYVDIVYANPLISTSCICCDNANLYLGLVVHSRG